MIPKQYLKEKERQLLSKIIEKSLAPIKNQMVKTILLMALFSITAMAQIDPGLRIWVQVGSLKNCVSAWGAERAFNSNTGAYDGLIWPGWYYFKQDNFCADFYYLVSKDFTDAKGEHWPYRATMLTNSKSPDYIAPISLTQTAKFYPPEVFVDGVPGQQTRNISALHDPESPFDRIITNILNTSMGVTVKHRVYISSQQYHDNYWLHEYTFYNTGNIDYDDEIELPNQTIKDFYFGGIKRYATSQEGALYARTQQAWGADNWVHHFGEDYDEYISGNSSADSLRGFYSWLGQGVSLAFNSVGAPHTRGNGRLAAPQFAGMAILHADKSPSDEADDPQQPHIIGWHKGDGIPSISGSVGELYPISGLNQTGARYLWEMLDGSGSAIYATQTEKMDKNHSIADQKQPQDMENNDVGGAAGSFSVGPYNLAFGDSVKMIYMEGVNGISRELCEIVGANWLKKYKNPNYAGDYSQLPFPPSVAGEAITPVNDYDYYKDSWVYTGKDSILRSMSRANRVVKNNLSLPSPPQPPPMFYVNSGGDRIMLSWTPSPSESEADFAGYAIFRSAGRPDTVYSKIADLPPGSTNFDDYTASRGISYFYYISAYNDGSKNPGITNPKGVLYSNRAYTQTLFPAYLQRAQGLDMANIRIVPNPFNINNREQQFGSGIDKDKIMFYNIPGKCIIRVYTERGDLVKTLEHTDGSGDHAWNSVSSTRQIVVSGLYIAHIEVTEDISDSDTGDLLYQKGDSVHKKFVVIR
jgi:hypothetical protein